MDHDPNTQIQLSNNALEAKIKAFPNKIELQLKNTSDSYIIVNYDDFELIHQIGRRTKLCGKMLKISPGEKGKTTLTICEGEPLQGLFGLKKPRYSDVEFIEESLYLNNKAFKLRLGEHWISFYTAY